MQKDDQISVRMPGGARIAASVKSISQVTGGVTVILSQDYVAYRKGDILQVKKYECQVMKNELFRAKNT